MNAKKIESLLDWFRKKYPSFKDGSYAWYNIHKILTESDIDRIRNFCIKRPEVEFFIIINGINPLRPQRTYGTLPEWFRNNTAYHNIYKDENAFVFINCINEEEYGNYGEYKRSKKNLFESAENMAKSIDAGYLSADFSYFNRSVNSDIIIPRKDWNSYIDVQNDRHLLISHKVEDLEKLLKTVKSKEAKELIKDIIDLALDGCTIPFRKEENGQRN